MLQIINVRSQIEPKLGIFSSFSKPSVIISFHSVEDIRKSFSAVGNIDVLNHVNRWKTREIRFVERGRRRRSQGCQSRSRSCVSRPPQSRNSVPTWFRQNISQTAWRRTTPGSRTLSKSLPFTWLCVRVQPAQSRNRYNRKRVTLPKFLERRDYLKCIKVKYR